MQEASRRRYALAQQIASHVPAPSKVAAMLVEGSVARDAADHSSDLDLAVFWYSNRDRACEDGRGEEACQPETRGWPQRPSSSGLRCREFSR